MPEDTTKVKAVSRRLRFEVMRRDNHTCRYCGATAPDVKLTVDHVIPRALGGPDTPENLVTACVQCNGGKTSIAPDQAVVTDVAETQFRWAAAIAKAGEMRRAEIAPVDHPSRAQFDAIWQTWNVAGEYLPRDPEWPATVAVFLKQGLNMDDLRHYVSVAMKANGVEHANRWRYFCGCCWKELERRTEIALQIMAESASREIEPWAVTEDGIRLYVDPLCAGCEGSGYRNLAHDTVECWCISQYPHTGEVR